MTNQQFISKLLDINQPMEETPIRFSTITLLLRGARKLFGCNLDSGKYEGNEHNVENYVSKTYHSFQLSGLIDYLIFLDQIGSIFKPKGKGRIPQQNGVFCALKYFSALDDKKIQTIRALRNSLAHQFGLATEKDPRLKPPRKFSLSVERNNEVIKFPANEWDGNFSDKSESTSTTVYIIDLIILIESVYQNIVKENDSDNLELLLADGIEELKTRFTIVY